MALRDIIRIDEELCDGCALCIPACAEGALAIVDGKAKLVSEVYCDGMGSCLGECPQGAITIEQREAGAYDEVAVEQHIAAQTVAAPATATSEPEPMACGCPGAMSREIPQRDHAQHAHAHGDADAGPLHSELRNWPVEMMLVPPEAPHYQGAKLLIAADCVPFAYAAFHRDMLAGRVLMVGCPKQADMQANLQKLIHIFKANDIKAVDVAFMEVPCCMGLVQAVKQALAASGKDIPARALRVGIDGGEPQEILLDELPF